MIPTSHILDALHQYLIGLGIFDRVGRHHAADLPEALESLRDPAATTCIIVPGEDILEHELMPDYNAPLRTEMRCQVSLLVAARDAAYGTSGAPAVLPLKDHLLALLMWETLSLPGLLCLPARCEPLRIEWDDAPATSAWQLTIECRQRITP